jgi:hypothetical protein
MQKQIKAEVGVLRRASFLPDLRSLDEKARTIEFVASTEKVDRYGDILRVAGWKLDAYKKNPVFLFAHKSGEPPIGKCVDIHTESNPPALVQTIQFADAATYPFADVIFNLYREGMMSAVSVGFLPLEMPNRITDLESNTVGYEFTSQELLELSAVPLPANSECLARAVTKGFAEADLERAFSGEAPNVYRELMEINQEIAIIAVSLAKATLLKANEVRALLEAGGVAETGEMSFAELLDAVKRTGASPRREEPSEEIDSVEALGEALEAGDGDEEFEKALGIGGEEVFSDSRKWRTGKLSIRRELR